MYGIAIIGSGQLGSRHLQGLKKANMNMSVFVVDTNLQALERAKERYEEVEDNFRINAIHYITNMDDLPSHLDLAIIATNSIPRADVARHLCTKKVANIIFEKFLFPSVSDYASVERCLVNNNTKAWVNCTRRHFSFYKDLKELLANATTMEMHVAGPGWGMACNSIHFIDLFAMLTGKQDFEIDTSLLEDIIDSKRSGYIELTGSVSGRSISGDYRFSLTSKEDCTPFSFLISTEKYKISIFESQKKAYIESSDGNKIEKEVTISYQSELTGTMAEQILLNGESDLPLYADAANLHIRFLKPVIEFYNKKTGENSDFCPIT